MVGYLTSTDRYFRISNGPGFRGTEAHFGIGGRWGPDLGADLDGAVWQWQDLDYQADANLDGNHRVISIETADNAPARPQDIAPWTPAQLDAIVDLVAWLCDRYDIPRVLIPDTLPGRRGVAYHRQGVDPWRVEGGERWSSSYGKACPGDRRIAQIRNAVMPRLRGAPVPEEDEMPRFVRCADNGRVYLIVPGEPARYVNGQEELSAVARVLGIPARTAAILQVEVDRYNAVTGRGPV